jgi:dihydrofolate reductase
MSTAAGQQHPGEPPGRNGSVVADMSVSLDGFVADPEDGVDRVFAWYGKPQPPRRSAGDGDSSPPGVIVYGRRTFDVANGWGGNHPLGVPVIVVTHTVPDGWPRPDSTVLFNTEGIESAIDQARTVAAGKDIALGSPTIIQQCLDLGLVNRLQVSLVPLLLGGGIRLFENLATAPIELENPVMSEGNGVTHLAYRLPRRVAT